jgi:predicted Zn finger-like uncharacterized protein
MVIRCPNCATRFKVADRLIGDKPVKLKCSKCQSVFEFKKEQAAEPVREPSPSHPRMPVVKPRGAQIGTAPAKSGLGPSRTIGAPAEPSPELDEGPSPEPAEGPSPEPAEGPSPELDEGPSPEPDEGPSPEPAEGPSPEPDEGPSPEPDEGPSPEPVEGPVEATPSVGPGLEEEFESFEEEEPAPVEPPAEEGFESFEEEPAEEPAQAEPSVEEIIKKTGELDDEDHTGVWEAVRERAVGKAAPAPAAPAPAASALAAPAPAAPAPAASALAAPAPAAPELKAEPAPVEVSGPSQPSVSSPPITLEDVLPQAEAPSRTGRVAGIFSAALLALILVFALFVLWRNMWDFSVITSDPVSAIRVAMGLAPRDHVSKQARGLEAAVADWFMVKTADDREILVVSGDVFNTTVRSKQLVLVEVGIVNSQGVAVFEQQTVAGVTFMTRQEMAQMSVLEILDRIDEDKRRAEKRQLHPDKKASFLVFFTTFPPGVEDPALYSIQARVESAMNAPSP